MFAFSFHFPHIDSMSLPSGERSRVRIPPATVTFFSVLAAVSEREAVNSVDAD